MDKKVKLKQLKQDSTLIGSWDEINAQPLSTITKRSEDTEVLDGLVIRGYEQKFADGTNTNGERYSKDAIDKFIKEYFVEKKLNMPLDIEHDSRPDWLVGRIIYIESNNVGFYYIGYVPKWHPKYDLVKNMLQEGMLQGFSKCGWATDWEWFYKNDGSFDYELIKEIQIVRMSLVSTPANGVPFEKIQEVQNATRFSHITDDGDPDNESKKNKVAFADLFRK